MLAATPPDTARERASRGELSRDDIEKQVRNAHDVHRVVQVKILKSQCTNY
jgi:hypothetical protein